MKKIISTLLALSILAISLVACGAPASSTPPAPESEAADTAEDAADDEATTDSDVEICDPERPLRSLQARQALSYALDRDAISNDFFKGFATKAVTLMPAALLPDGTELDQYDYNPEKAKELLEACQWPADYEIEVFYIYDNQETADLMAAVQAYWAAVGVKMSARLVTGDFTEILWTSPVAYDIYYGAKGASTGSEYYSQFLSDYSGNSTVQPNPELDALITAYSSAVDGTEREAALKALAEYENQNMFWLPLYQLPHAWFVSDRVTVPDTFDMYGGTNWIYDVDYMNWDVEPNENGEKVVTENPSGPGEGASEHWSGPGGGSRFYVFEGLIWQNADGSYSRPALAESFEVSDDFMEITVTLRDNLQWHDGDPITAEDVKWSFEYASNITFKSAIFQASIERLEGYDDYESGASDEISGIVIDGNTITFTYAEPDPDYLTTFAQLTPLPKKYFENVAPEEFQTAAFWQHPIGSGAYMFDEIVAGDYATKIAFENYYDGRANIDRVTMLNLGSDAAANITRATAGEVDVIGTNVVDVMSAVSEMENYSSSIDPVFYTRFMWINNNEKEAD